MADIFTKEKRSEIMALNKPKDTKLEKLVFSELRKRKIYFQKHYRTLAGIPDIALPRKKKAVYVDGDFWHGYNYSVLNRPLPSTYWEPKIKRNIARDKAKTELLESLGRKVLRIWEHELNKKNFDETIGKIVAFLKSS